jgi:transglutaminase-like putative cysteine protease
MKVISRIREEPFSLFFYAASFLLLYEWLNPLKFITDTEKIGVFIFFIALSLCNYAFKMHLLPILLLKSIYILFSIHSLYFDVPFFNGSWLLELFSQVGKDVRHLWMRDIYQLSSEFRSLLFFILLWLLCYLVYYWVFFQKKILLFFGVTVIYITVLDTFSHYNAKYAIIRVVTVGFIFISLLSLERIKTKEFHAHQNIINKKLLMIVSLIVFLTTTMAYFLPKAGPQWPDPVPFLKGYANGTGGREGASNIQKIGYGINDSQLGGPFIGDSTVVFYAEAAEKHYWRIETKDVYSGKGWEVSEKRNAVPMNKEKMNLFQYGDNVSAMSLTSYIEFIEPSIHLMYPLSVTALKLNEEVTLKVNPLTEKLYPYRGEGMEEVSGYEVTYTYPSFRVETLQGAKVDSVESNPQFKRRYTQLPPSLPDRVRDLARNITKGALNRYDQAKAIERYFEANPYAYDTQNVAVPGEGEDYVDQFLFETKRGYCDNFSTSMVVMLRSLDIPARWIKGYTYGKAVDTMPDGHTRYEVTQNDAHSWVEVYFPNVGWVPFEPTKSFSNPYEFTYGLSSNSNSNTGVNQETQTPAPVKPEVKTREKKEQTDVKTKERTNVSWIGILFLILSLAGAAGFVYFTKNRWFHPFLIFIYKKREDEEVFEEAYLSLLKQLENYGLKREKGLTLSQYAKYVDRYFETREMSTITERYERVLYRKDEAKIEWVNSRELWENLIKKTSS